MAALIPEVALRYLLTTSAAVTALVGSRVSPGFVSELSAFPFIAYSLIASQHERHLQGPSGLVFRRYQLDIYSRLNSELCAISDAIRNRLDGYVGVVTIGADSLRMQNVELLDQRDNYISPTDGSDVGIYRRSLDFRISHGETIPTHL